MSSPCFVICRRCEFAIPAGPGWLEPHACSREQLARVDERRFEDAARAAGTVLASIGPGEVDADGRAV